MRRSARRPRLVSRAGALFACALAASGASSGAVWGQTAFRTGVWFEGGSGAGMVRSACSACPSATVAYGTSSHLRVGYAIAPQVLLGLELFALHSSELALTDGLAPVDAENGSLGPVVMWYAGGSGLFLKGGVGLARGTFTVRPASDDAVTAERGGLAITFGLGFDVGVTSWLAITANAGTYVTAIGDFVVDGTVADDIVATVYEAGIGLTLR